MKLKDKFLQKVKISDLIKLNFEKFNTDKKINIKQNQLLMNLKLFIEMK